MSKLIRFSVSIPKKLYENFDDLIKEKGYKNRSEALRDMMRDALMERDSKYGGTVFGSITLIYDHHKRNISEEINKIQHEYSDFIISTSHVHVDGKRCMEVILVKGEGKKLKKFADMLIGMKGVSGGEMVGLGGKALFE